MNEFPLVLCVFSLFECVVKAKNDVMDMSWTQPFFPLKEISSKSN